MSYLKSKDGSLEASIKEMQKNIKDSAYQDMFKKELEKAGKGIGAMSPQEKKDFFNKIDKMHKAKNEDLNKDDEKVVNKVKDMLKGASAKHAAQAKMLDKAMKTEADLSKATIKKVHKMADELPKKDFKDRYGKEKGDSVRYATATNMIKKKMGMKEEDEKEMPKKEKKEGNKDATIDSLKDKINILQTKLENEKNKAVKPEPNPETGEVPLTVGVAYKHLRDKMKKRTMERFEVNEEDKNNYDAESGIKQKQIAKGTPKKTDTGEKSTPVVMNPKVDYKY